MVGIYFFGILAQAFFSFRVGWESGPAFVLTALKHQVCWIEVSHAFFGFLLALSDLGLSDCRCHNLYDYLQEDRLMLLTEPQYWRSQHHCRLKTTTSGVIFLICRELIAFSGHVLGQIH